MKRKLFATIVTTLLGISVHAQTNAPLISYPVTNSSTPSQNSMATGNSGLNSRSSTSTSSTVAMAGRIGAGVTFGEPIGGTVKYFFTDTVAAEGSLGWSSADHADLYLDAAVIWNYYDLIHCSRGAVPVYIGIGPLLRIKEDNFDNESGIRVPIGISYFFEDTPIEVFGEIGPALDVSPVMRGEITGGIGIRYWF